MLKTWFTLALPFSLLMSALYLCGFWIPFRLNVLEFIGIGDIAKLALMPLVIGMVPLFFSAGVMTIFHKPYRASTPRDVPKWFVVLRRFERWIGLLLLVAIFSVSFFVDSPWKWMAVTELVMILGMPALYWTPIVQLCPSRPVRTFVFAFATSALGLSFTWGAMSANMIMSGHAALLVDMQRSHLDLGEAPMHPLEYIGRVGDYFFLFETKSQTLIFVKPKDNALLALVPNPS